MEVIPDGLVLLQEIVEVPDGLETFINFVSFIYVHICAYISEFGCQMHDKASHARSDDTKTLKREIVHYLPLDWKNEVIMPPILIGGGKTLKSTTRGFHHPYLARLLCPRRQLDEFDIDPKYSD